jgi:hypothetical protein
MAEITDRDEISLGSRFASKLQPKIVDFLDKTFGDDASNPEYSKDIAKLKKITSFFELIDISREKLINMHIRSEYVMKTLFTACANWSNKYRFPAYQFQLCAPPPAVVKV